MAQTEMLEQDPTLALAAPALARDPLVADPWGPEDDATRVRRLYNRFLYCWGHPFWTKWRREAREDLAFMAGDQWPEDVRRELEKDKRACLTINQIRPVIQILVGYERASRLEMRPAPVGEEDLETATLFARLMKKTEDEEEVGFILSEGFKEGAACGLCTWYVGVDYSDDLIYGRPFVHKTRPGEVVWDPDWTSYSLRDARDVFWYKVVPVDELLAQFPDKREDIRLALDVIRAGNPSGPIYIPAHDLNDPYSLPGPESIPLYDPMRDEVLVLECWYRTWETVHLLIDRVDSNVVEIPAGDGAALAVARATARVAPKRYRVVSRQRRRVAMCTLLPALLRELEQGTPFENDREDYPFVPFLVYREGDELMGIIRNLKDPQREVNKRRSALVDNVTRHGDFKWFSTRQALENPEFLTEPARAGRVGWIKSPALIPKEVGPQPLPEWVWQMDGKAKNEIREISGVNADLLGYRDPDSSGIAIARRQQQGQIGSAEIFDNYRRSRRQVGRRLAKRIQQVYTGEQTVRLDPGAGQSAFVQLNQRVVDEQGRIRVVRDIPSLKFDIEIVDSPATPTARANALSMFLELIKQVPSLGPLLADILVELTDVPDRERILQRIRQAMGSGALTPKAPGQGGPSGPSPYTPPPGPTVVGAPQPRQRTAASNTPLARQGIGAGITGPAM